MAAARRLRKQVPQFTPAVLELVPAQVCVLDEVGKIVFSNQAWRDHACCCLPALPGDHLGVDYLAACDQAVLEGSDSAGRVGTAIRRVLAGEAEADELRLFCDLVSGPCWRMLKVACFQENGTRRVALICDDITSNVQNLQQASAALEQEVEKSRQAEAALSASQEQALVSSETKFRRLFEEALDGIILVDEKGIIVEWNQASERIFGLPRTAVLGRPFWEVRLQTLAGPQPGPAEVEAFRARVSQALQNGLVGAMEQVFEFWVARPNGSRRLVEQHVFPIKTEQGYWLGATIRDVTDARQVEAALRVSEQKYRVLFETFPQGITIIGTQGQVLEINQAAECLLGLSLDEHQRRGMDGEQWRAFRTDGSPMPAGEVPGLRALKENRLVEDVELGLARPDGEVIWLNVTAAPIPLEGYGVVVIYGDITRRKQAEEALQRLNQQLDQRVAERTAELAQTNAALLAEVARRERLQQEDRLKAHMLDRANDGILLFNLYGDVVYANQTFERRLNLPRQQILRLNYHDLNQQVTDDSNIQFQQILEKGLVIFDVSRQLPGGGVVSAEVQAQRIEVAGQEFILAVSRDISERKQAEQALRASEAQWHSLTQNAPDIVFTVDREARLLYINRVPDGLTPEQVKGTSVLDFVQPEYRPLVQEKIADVFATGLPATYEAAAHGPNNAEAWYSTALGPVEVDGKIEAVILVTRDITERRKVEEALIHRTAELHRANAELARAVRAKDEFLANMSHELRTPLTGILGLSEALQEQVYGPLNARQLEVLNSIAEAGNQLHGVINDILDLAKYEAGKMELEFCPLSIDNLCASSLRMMRQVARKKKLELQYENHCENGLLTGDERRLKQILVNLLSNAVKFTPAGGQVGLLVTSDQDRREISFTVWDTGIGIDPEDQRYLFQPFTQLDGGLNRHASGSGLGLSLVKRLAELHGGEVTLQSEPQLGSRFTVTIPWIKPEGLKAVGGTRPAGYKPSQPERQATLLLADDSESNRWMVAEYLRLQGYGVLEASNGLETLDKVRVAHPDLVLLDIQMPGMTGLEVLRCLQDDAELQYIPVIILSAHAMPGDRERFLAAGAQDYLSKPFSLKQLLAAITRLVNQ